MSIQNKGVLIVEVPSMQDLQKLAGQSQSSEDYKQLTLEKFEAAPQWPAARRVNVKWKPLSVSNDMERNSLICLRVRQISASSAVLPLSDVPKVVQSLYQLTNSIQKQQVRTYDHLWKDKFNLSATQIKITSYKLCIL